MLVATADAVLMIDHGRGSVMRTKGLEGVRPTGLAADPLDPDRAYCGTRDRGVLRTEDGGRTWRLSGLEGERITALAVGPDDDGPLWAGAEPSRVWRSRDRGDSWASTADLSALPSSSQWAFPPRPKTHHVRWIACHPADADRLWVAIEAGALVRTHDGGATWLDRVEGGPHDTHELTIHADDPQRLHVAAGDGAFTSADAGLTWSRSGAGLEVGYMRSVAVDPDDAATVVISGASGPRSAYAAGKSDGRVYRRVGDGPWSRVEDVWGGPPSTIAPLLRAGTRTGALWAADERGVHRSEDGGRAWTRAATFETAPASLTGFVVG